VADRARAVRDNRRVLPAHRALRDSWGFPRARGPVEA
jgi:hypothetical protein